MALPTNRIKKIKTPDGNTYDVVPEMLSKDGYSAELPDLTANSTIALTSDIPNNYVTTNTDQTINSVKTYKKYIYMNKDDTWSGNYGGNDVGHGIRIVAPSMVANNRLVFLDGGKSLNLNNSAHFDFGYVANESTDNYINFGFYANDNRLKLYANGILENNGDIKGTTFYEGGTSLANKYLGISAKAADSDLLDGNDSTYYLNYNNLTNKPSIPTTYLKSASVSGTFSNTLTISKQDDTLVNFYNYFHSPTYSTGLSIASGRGVNDLYVPEASTTSSGVMSTSTQTFVGIKTFKSSAFTSYGAVMPDTSSYTANKTIATTDLIVSAEFVEEVPTITFTVANTPSGTITFEVPENSTWEDLVNNGVKDSTNTYTISIYNGNVTLNSNVQYIISTASNRNNPVSTTSIPTDGTTYYYVNPASLN